MFNTLKISNLPAKVGEAEIEGMFSLIGNVKEVRIIRNDVSGVSLGIAVVEMSTEDEMRDGILHYNGKTLEGQTIFVRENKPHVADPTKKTISQIDSKNKKGNK